MKKEKTKCHCNECGRTTNHEILFAKKKTWEEDEIAVWGGDKFELLECCGCESVKIKHTNWFSEDMDHRGNIINNEIYYPSALYRPLPEWHSTLDNEWEITKLIREVYSALQNDAPSLALMGIRAIIEAVMLEAVGDNGSFGKNLKEFQKRGYISKIQEEVLTKALEAGHASIHRSFIPESKHVNICMDICENLIETLHVLNHSSKVLERDVPPRKSEA